LGDAMANLLLTPAILYWPFGYRDRRRSLNSGRLVEGLILTAGLIGLALVAFSGRLAKPYDFLALLYAPVVFLMWAAIRFGLKGASAALTLSAFLAVIAAVEGRTPFAMQSAQEHTLWIQLFVLAVALPVLFLAVIVRERDDGAVALRQSEGRYREVVNSQTELICRYLPDTTLTFVNEAYCRFFGRSRENLIGRRFLELIPEAERDAARNHVRALIENRPVDPAEHSVACPDGSLAWIHWVDHVIRGREGRVVELQSIGRDITDRKNAEEARHLLAQAARLAQLGELTASIAHEINQPLGAILSNADAAEMLLETGHLDEIRNILADIRRDDVRAGEVISRVRGLVRRRQTDPEPLDLPAVTVQVMRLAEAEARRRGVSIRVEFEPSLPFVRADRILIQQVLLNLILNGIDAMADTLPGERRLGITAGYVDRFVEVAVADSGHGIAESLLPSIFDSFVTSREDGMGLGLAISRSIVQAHGGRIWAENNTGAGSTLRFTLPIDNGSRFPSATTI
ncbi:MAG TPA: ATP-binding protein, partial [Thermoanaerobaculia bacterium]